VFPGMIVIGKTKKASEKFHCIKKQLHKKTMHKKTMLRQKTNYHKAMLSSNQKPNPCLSGCTELHTEFF
jgi:hypothetical protein